MLLGDWDHLHDVIDEKGQHWIYVDKTVEPEEGLVFEKGYYDDDGNYYADIGVVQNSPYGLVLAKCPYCNSIHRAEWEEGSPLVCKNCGGPLKVLKEIKRVDEKKQAVLNAREKNLPNARKTIFSAYVLVLGFILIVVLIIFFSTVSLLLSFH